MAGVVAAGIPGDHRKPVGKNVNDLSLPLVAPLGAHYHCSLGSHESILMIYDNDRKMSYAGTA
jgi:hypothetical protein